DFGIKGLILYGDQSLRIPNAEIGRDNLLHIDGPDCKANPLINESFSAIGLEYNKEHNFTGDGGDYLYGGERFVIDSLLRKGKVREAIHLIWDWANKNKKTAGRFLVKYGLIPFIPVLKEYMYKKYVWDEEVEVNIPHFFSKE